MNEETKKMLQAILNSVSALRQEMLNKFEAVEKKFQSVDERFNNLEEQMHEFETNITKRVDNLGLRSTYVDEDTPTREEFDQIENRVEKLEHKSN